jgi:hypothetical protein
MRQGISSSNRHEFFHFAGPQLDTLRLDNFKFQFICQSGGKVATDFPTLIARSLQSEHHRAAARGCY